MSEQIDYELLAKNNVILAKVLGMAVALVQLFEPSTQVIVAFLFILSGILSTISTYAWMSR
jgi:hypothetical protein